MHPVSPAPRKVNILGVGVNTYSLADLLTLMQRAIRQGGRLLITHVNAHGLHIAWDTPWYRGFLNRSDVTYCDGMGVQLAARMLGTPIPERYTLADWYPQLAGMATERGFSLFFLGSAPGIAAQAAQNLRQHFPDLQVAGYRHGFFDHAPESAENRTVVDAVNAAHADILMVGMGMPLQERWLMENWARLDVRVAITGGAIFEYMAGEMRRGPAWMTQHSLEWLFRLIDRPDRYAKRYWVENPLFLLRALRQRFFGLPFA